MKFSLLFASIFVKAVLHKEFVGAKSDKLLERGINPTTATENVLRAQVNGSKGRNPILSRSVNSPPRLGASRNSTAPHQCTSNSRYPNLFPNYLY
jgi:hypothetical protein